MFIDVTISQSKYIAIKDSEFLHFYNTDSNQTIPIFKYFMKNRATAPISKLPGELVLNLHVNNLFLRVGEPFECGVLNILY